MRIPVNVTTDSGNVTGNSGERDRGVGAARFNFMPSCFSAEFAFLVLDFFFHRPLPGPPAGPPRLCMYSCITSPRPGQWGHDDQAVMVPFAAGVLLRIDSPVSVKR